MTEDFFSGIALDPGCQTVSLVLLMPCCTLGFFFVLCIACYERCGKDQERTVFSIFAEHLAQLVLLGDLLCIIPLIVRFGFGTRIR